MPKGSATEGASGRRVRLKTKNEFDLIRLLARSQSDARKAVAELVQNSLDATAHHIEIEWFQDRGQRVLSITDDGAGIFPDLEREEALVRIARTIGYSHKRDLSPGERRELMVLGKYGIGLLGFWCVGEEMEIESRVAGGETWCLRLREDRPEGRVVRSRARRIDREGTFTRISIRGVHESVQNRVRPPRLQAYLAQELRGQLLDREVVLQIHDRVARGRSTKLFPVRPKPFLGVPLEAWRTLEVPGHDDARLDLYYVSDEERRHGRVALTCGGTVVLDDIALIEGDDAPRTPWDSGQIEGTIDFPDLTVAPSTRRGFQHDGASAAFFDALARLEFELLSRILDDNERRAEERRRTVAQKLRRMFRPVAKELPEYELFDPQPPANARRAVVPALGTRGRDRGAGDAAEADDGLLFPPGPVAQVQARPARMQLSPGAERTIRARVFDGDGRPPVGSPEFTWELDGDGFLSFEGDRATYTAGEHEGRASVRVVARDGDHVAAADALVIVADDPAADPRGRIPEPVRVHAPSEPWRSRVVEDRWEFNAGHPDYRAVESVESRRLRYLGMLFAKELVLRNFGGAPSAELLERMVQVMTRLVTGR